MLSKSFQKYNIALFLHVRTERYKMKMQYSVYLRFATYSNIPRQQASSLKLRYSVKDCPVESWRDSSIRSSQCTTVAQADYPWWDTTILFQRFSRLIIMTTQLFAATRRCM